MFYSWPFVIPNLFSFMSPTLVTSISAPDWYYAPATEWGEGDQIIEKRISKELATSGRQLGIMGDALVAIINYIQHPENGIDEKSEEAIGRFISLVRQVEKIVTEEEARKGSTKLRKIEPVRVNLPVRRL